MKTFIKLYQIMLTTVFLVGFILLITGLIIEFPKDLSFGIYN